MSIRQERASSRPPLPVTGAGVGDWGQLTDPAVGDGGCQHDRGRRRCWSCGASARRSGRCRPSTASTSVPRRQGDRARGRQRRRQVGDDQDHLGAVGTRRRARSSGRARPVHIHSPNDAEALGITTIYQDLALCDNLDIVQNMFLGHEKLRLGLLDESAMEIEARKILADLHVTTVRSIRQPVASLSGGQRQSVAVAKAVMSAAKLVIMDEPTAALGVAQTRMVLDLIKRLASQGTAVMMVSHNLPDVFAVADQISILYLGRLVAQGPASDFDPQVVVEYMTTGQSTRGRPGERAMTDTVDEPDRARRRARQGPTSTPAHAEPSALDHEAARRSGARRPGRLPRRLPPGLVEAHPRRRERRAADHHRASSSSASSSRCSRARSSPPANIVNLFVQAAFIILLGLAELYALILSEIDLSVGFVGAVGAAIALALMGPPQNWPWWAAVIVGPGRLRRHRRLPGHAHHPAQDPVLRRDPGRAPGLAGRPDLRLRRRQGRRRRRDLHLQRRDRRPRQRQHDAGRRLDRPGRRRRALRRRLHPPHLPSTVPGPERATAGHHGR